MGPLETVVATRALARSARCPWLFDIKDNIDIYLRRSLRWPVKQRIRGWAALQANSRLHGETASRWLKTPIETVYSGVDACFFERRKDPQLAATPYVTIVGSLYRPDLVREIVEGIAESNRRTGRTLGIVHLGTQLAMLQEANTALGSPLSIQCPGYVSTDEMAAICQQAVANIYVFLGMTFHHKLFELLACDRPTIAYGGELPESIEEAHRLGKPLSTPQSTGQLAETLDQLEVAEHCSAPKASHPFFTWQEQAAKVERALERLMSA